MISKRPSRNILKKLYIDNNISITKVADVFGVSCNSVIRWLKFYEIKKSAAEIEQCRTATNIEKYGTGNAAASDEIKKKIKSTNIARYGVGSTLLLKNVKDKIENTNEQRYGSKNPFGSKKIQKKIAESNIEKTGNPYPSQCNISSYVAAAFSSKEAAVEYLKDNDLVGKTIAEICSFTGYSIPNMTHKIERYDIFDLIDCNPPRSKEEDELENLLKSWGINNIVRNDRKLLGGKEMDIYLPDYDIGIEFNGSYWHSEKFKDKDYQIDKINLAASKGIFLFCIYGYEWSSSERENIVKELRMILRLDSWNISSNEITIPIERSYDKSFMEHGYKMLRKIDGSFIWWKSDKDCKTIYEIDEQRAEEEGYIKIYNCGYRVWRR